MSRSAINALTSLAVIVLASTYGAGHAAAEPALDKVLASVQAAHQKRCTALSIFFNLRVRYLSHFPAGRGEELRIALRPIDGPQAAAEILSRRESLRPPESKFARIKSIFFEAGNAAEPALVLIFDRPTNYQVAQGDDFQSVVIKLFGDGGPTACKADFAGQGEIGQWSTAVNRDVNTGPPPAGRRRKAGGTASADQVREAEALMDEGRAALRKKSLGDAITKFSRVLSLPETPSSAEAQELLGVALQRDKRPAEARAEYEAYLASYPSGEGADRVRQRLTGLETSTDAGKELKAPKSARQSDDGRQTWTLSGSASQFYIRDDSFRTLRDPSLPPSVNEDLDLHDTHQNEILTSLDVIATWSNAFSKSKFRFSGTEEHKFDDDDDREIVGVAALFLDTTIRDWDASARVGRQTRNTGGVLGRFDGGVFSYSATQDFRINAVVGSPVLRRRDAPFEDDKYFYGASVDFGPFYGFDLTLFAIEQRDRSILDRQAVGAEARYVDVEKSAFATFDYDIHFNELNAAIVNGSWTYAPGANVHAAFDYRKSPYLSTWTALQGQAFPTLYEMLKVKTLAEIEALAVDRTASFTSYSAGFAQPINDKLLASFDATVTNYSGTPASDIVPATEGTGNEYFYSAQVIGNNVFGQDDLLIAGLRFADLQKSDYTVLDISFRYPLIENLKINPRLMIGYRTGDNTDLVEYTVLPSILLDYYVSRDWSLEMEVGAQWTDSSENGVDETTTDLFLTIGYRYDFYHDGETTSQARAAPYGVGAAAGR